MKSNTLDMESLCYSRSSRTSNYTAWNSNHLRDLSNVFCMCNNFSPTFLKRDSKIKQHCPSSFSNILCFLSIDARFASFNCFQCFLCHKQRELWLQSDGAFCFIILYFAAFALHALCSWYPIWIFFSWIFQLCSWSGGTGEVGMITIEKQYSRLPL